MRIISGDARGRRLYAPAGEETRPTADRVREALFNILGARVRGARVLDLFGGTGAMALEALSRGAAHAVVVDSARTALEAIERNARAVLGEDAVKRARIIRADYRAAIDQLAVRGAGEQAGGQAEERFDLVFLDPPYRMADAYADALTRLRAARLLEEDYRVVLERAREQVVKLPPGFERLDVRDYGKTSIEFVREVPA